MARRLPRGARLASIALSLGFGAYVAATTWWTVAPPLARPDRASNPNAGAATVADAIPVREIGDSAEGTVWQLGGGLETAPVHAIAPAASGDGAWLGTGLGLVRLWSDGHARRFRSFPAASREWARHVTVTDAGVALTLAVASGSNEVREAGTWLFHPQQERFERIGEASRALASDGTALYGVQGRTLVRFVREGAAWRSEPLPAQPRICRTVALAWGAGALWTTGQGRVRVGRQHAREVPCGISRVGPQGGVATWDDDEDGLVSAFGRDVAVDARDAVVSFGIQGDGLALLDPQARSRWRHRRAASSIRLNANAVALSPGAIWLATPDGRRPLVRYDRLHGEARRVRAVPENHWVRALAADVGGAWAAFVRERWVDGTPSVETWVLRAREAGPRLTASDTSAQRAPRAWPGGRRGRTDP